jgi:two-component system nitrogen regulation response regulator GlnG
MAAQLQHDRPLLALSIAWHPQIERIGAQFVVSHHDVDLELSRFVPSFNKPNEEALPLGFSGISRDPLRFKRDNQEGVQLTAPNSRMAVEINGVEMTGSCYLSFEQIEDGVVIGLGRAVLICMHWMKSIPRNNNVPGFIGIGQAALSTRDLIRQAALNDNTVLLLGETGTGKEVAAKGLHNLSKRANKPMVCVNMATLNESLAAADLFGAAKGAYTGAQQNREGYFGQADQGSLFLDEIGNTPQAVQAMLLRVLESKEYRPVGAVRDLTTSARLITATDQNLYDASFNQALLRRLEHFVIPLPPLRQRREDIGSILLDYLQKKSNPSEINGAPFEFISDLLNYDWPGNIRQLGNIIERYLVARQMGEHPSLSQYISVNVNHPNKRLIDTPRSIIQTPISAEPLTNAQSNEAPKPDRNNNITPRNRLKDLSHADVLNAMEKHGWTIQYAAQYLGVSRPSMYKLLEAHPEIRRVEQINQEEIRQAWELTQNNIELCASRLRTPNEALRRHLKGLGLIDTSS